MRSIMDDKQIFDMIETYEIMNPEIANILRLLDERESYLLQIDQLEQSEKQCSIINSNAGSGRYEPIIESND